jgi:hypothetical protein
MRLSFRISDGISDILTEVLPGFPQSIQAYVRIVTLLSHVRFFLNHYQINFYPSFIHSTPYKPDIESIDNSSQLNKLIGQRSTRNIREIVCIISGVLSFINGHHGYKYI